MSKVKIQKLTEEEIRQQGIRQWPVWAKEVSRFDWTYYGEEQCLFLEGDVVIETKEGKFHIEPGDFVTFEQGLDCIWDIRKPVKKHYNFP
ncbi:MAG: cupin domain-containing protein [Bacteroidota bacterium]